MSTVCVCVCVCEQSRHNVSVPLSQRRRCIATTTPVGLAAVEQWADCTVWEDGSLLRPISTAVWFTRWWPAAITATYFAAIVYCQNPTKKPKPTRRSAGPDQWSEARHLASNIDDVSRRQRANSNYEIRAMSSQAPFRFHRVFTQSSKHRAASSTFYGN